MDHPVNRRYRIMAPLARITVALILGLVLVSTPGHAGEEETLWPRFAISLGDFITTTDSTIRVDATSVDTGTNIDFESDLGLGGSENVLTAQFAVMMGQRNELTFSYLKISREARHIIDEEITFGDTAYPVDAEVDTALRQTQIELGYTFWALRRERAGLGVSLGIVDLGLEAELLTRLQVGGYELELREEVSTHAPVPLLGLRGRGLVGDRFILTGDLRFLPNVTIDTYTGSAYSVSAGAEWRISRHFGIGASYDVFSIDVDLDDGKWQGSAGTSTSGVRIFGRLLF